MGFIVCVCYFFMTIVDISTSAKDGKLLREIVLKTSPRVATLSLLKRQIYQDFQASKDIFAEFYKLSDLELCRIPTTMLRY